MLVLVVIVPLLIRFLRPYYSQQNEYYPLAVGDFSDSEEPELGNSDRLDVHLAFVACVIVAIFFLCIAISTTKLALIVCKCSATILSFISFDLHDKAAVFLGLGSMHSPTIRSLIVGSVDTLKQGWVFRFAYAK